METALVLILNRGLTISDLGQLIKDFEENMITEDEFYASVMVYEV